MITTIHHDVDGVPAIEMYFGHARQMKRDTTETPFWVTPSEEDEYIKAGWRFHTPMLKRALARFASYGAQGAGEWQHVSGTFGSLALNVRNGLQAIERYALAMAREAEKQLDDELVERSLSDAADDDADEYVSPTAEQKAALEEALMLMNAKHVGTGGGCTAYEIDFGESYLLITDGDANAPETLDDKAGCALYRRTPNGDEVDEDSDKNFPSLRALLRDVFGNCEGDELPAVLREPTPKAEG